MPEYSIGVRRSQYSSTPQEVTRARKYAETSQILAGVREAAQVQHAACARPEAACRVEVEKGSRRRGSSAHACLHVSCNGKREENEHYAQGELDLLPITEAAPVRCRH